MFPFEAAEKGHANNRTTMVLVAITLAAVAWVGVLRWRLVTSTLWQCDEIPLLVRSTGLCGRVSNEAEAVRFQPTFYSWYMGALRSLRTPKYYSSIHTSTAFWANLTIHGLGCTPAAGRLAPFLFSLLAIGAAAYAARMMFGGLIAPCVAATVVTLSPAATAFAAQTRGYSEALALSPLLLIALERYRHQPLSILRWGTVLASAFLLSLTIYTTWVFWVLPILVTALLWPHAATRLDGTDGRTGCEFVKGQITRLGLSCIVASMLLVMGVYTLERADHLLGSSSQYGIRLRSLSDGLRFVVLVADMVMSPWWVILPLAVVGIVAAGRSPARWWLWGCAASLVVTAAVAAVVGSAGYERNLLFWLSILAVLAGGGAQGILNALKRRWSFVPTPAVAALSLVCLFLSRLPKLPAQAAQLMPSDWSEMVATRTAESTSRQLLFANCPANHWQTNWYAPTEPFSGADRPEDEEVEVVMGALLNRAGRPFVFRRDPQYGSIKEAEIPSFAGPADAEVRFRGLSVWTWLGRRDDFQQIAKVGVETPIFMVAESNAIGKASNRELDEAWEGLMAGGQAIGFRTQMHGHRTIRTAIVSSKAIGTRTAALRALADRDEKVKVQWLRLRQKPIGSEKVVDSGPQIWVR